MTKPRRTITISTELDEAIAKLAVSKKMNYSEFVESRLRTVPIIEQIIEKLESLPDMPQLNVQKIKANQQHEVLNKKIAAMKWKLEKMKQEERQLEPKKRIEIKA